MKQRFAGITGALTGMLNMALLQCRFEIDAGGESASPVVLGLVATAAPHEADDDPRDPDQPESEGINLQAKATRKS